MRHTRQQAYTNMIQWGNITTNRLILGFASAFWERFLCCFFFTLVICNWRETESISFSFILLFCVKSLFVFYMFPGICLCIARSTAKIKMYDMPYASMTSSRLLGFFGFFELGSAPSFIKNKNITSVASSLSAVLQPTACPGRPLARLTA